MELIELLKLWVSLFLCGMAGQSVRAVLGIMDANINKEPIDRNRFLVSFGLGGICGAITSYLAIPSALTGVGILLAVFSGLGWAYIIENLHKIAFR